LRHLDQFLQEFFDHHACSTTDEDAQRAYREGLLAHLEERLEAAAVAYGCALALDPNLAEVYDHYSVLLLRLGRFAEATRIARQGLTRVADPTRLWLAIGVARSMLGQHRAALRAFREARKRGEPQPGLGRDHLARR
jgi:tetratricopeptide (TPR) repeat protein